ncbi:tRNA-splicing endonuclease subunit [Dimargaris cristalligena]|nr:tRNA-splicing endonuclease subunit [Dimargaris cristalligena]
MAELDDYIASPPTVATKCDIVHCGQVGLVWNEKDVETLKTKYRMVGSHISNVTEQAMSNNGCSLPWILSAEEVTLLLQIDAIQLVSGFEEEDALIEGDSEDSSWNYPTTPLETMRFRLFEDLWRRGYYLTPGIKFGGEFLVYLGDPQTHHSRFITTLLESAEQTINPVQLVALSRLGTGVTKSRLLSVYSSLTQSFEYITVNWSSLS